MMAIEIVDPDTGAPDAALTARVHAAVLAQGVVLLTCGTWGNVIRFLPPLAISDELLTEGIDIVGKALANV
jgi:4-aminobutyrate aminotransferase/(S)-3-amino-2-methylpropionate transaminase